MSETSDRVSRLAGRYINVTGAELARRAQSGDPSLAADIRSMAASLLRQDESPGLRGRVKRFLWGST